MVPLRLGLVTGSFGRRSGRRIGGERSVVGVLVLRRGGDCLSCGGEEDGLRRS